MARLNQIIRPINYWLVDVGGIPPPLKYDCVSWDDAIPNMMGKIWKNHIHVPNHQSDIVYDIRSILIYIETKHLVLLD
jgi:hypothetical protein